MSTIVQAVIPGVMHDVECVQEALSSLNMSAQTVGSDIRLSNGVVLRREPEGLAIVYEGYEVQIGSFVRDFTVAYRAAFEKKVERLQLEEARLREKIALEEFSEAERRIEESRIRSQLEEIQRTRVAEREQMRKICQERSRAIQESAQRRGYSVREEVKEGRRVLVLVRRAA